MGSAASILLVSTLAALPVEVSTLNGEQRAGTLVTLTSENATVSGEGGELAIPLTNLLEVRFVESKTGEPEAKLGMVRLTDGSRLSIATVSANAKAVKGASPNVGNFDIDPSAVASIRFAPPDERVEGDWQKLRERQLKRDLLVIRKGDVLDYQDGIVGDIDDKVVKFSLEGEEIPVKREKVFGIIYARRPASQKKPLCRIDLATADELFVKSVKWDGQRLTADLLAGANVELKVDAVRSLDFSLGKVQFLSQMEPRDVKYTPFFDITWEYRRDRNLDGGPIRVGKQEYARGLSIHSRTSLRYRLGGDFRKFLAVMGIDAAVANNGRGDVHVVISGDGKTLFEADVRGSDAPRPLELDITGVRDLDILVDFGGDLDISDHLDLADARVIK